MNNKLQSEELYELVLEKYNEIKSNLKSKKAIESLDRVKETIDFYINEGIDFSVASIGRFCENKWESPKTQSIRNSKELMKYINFRQDNENINPSKSKNKTNNSFIDNIEDEQIKSYIRIEKEKYKTLENKYNDLKKFVSQIQPVDIDKLIENNLDVDNPIDLVSDIITQVDDTIDKEIDTYFNQNNKEGKKLLNEDDFTEFVEVLNTKFLNKLEVELIYKNGMVINKNTGSIIYTVKGN